MQLDRPTIVALVMESITAPRSAARRMMSVGDAQLALLALACVATLSALLSVILSRMSPASGNPDMDYLMTQPLLLAGLQAAGMTLFAGLVTGVGRLFGGTGRFAQILLALAWLGFLLLVVQMGMLVLMLALPSLGGVLKLAVIALVIWLLASFIAEVHGFRSTFFTAAVLIGSLLMIGMGLVLLSPPM